VMSGWMKSVVVEVLSRLAYKPLGLGVRQPHRTSLLYIGRYRVGALNRWEEKVSLGRFHSPGLAVASAVRQVAVVVFLSASHCLNYSLKTGPNATDRPLLDQQLFVSVSPWQDLLSSALLSWVSKLPFPGPHSAISRLEISQGSENEAWNEVLTCGIECQERPCII
jgi:hypothetical protein